MTKLIEGKTHYSSLDLDGCTSLTSLPDNLSVGGELDLSQFEKECSCPYHHKGPMSVYYRCDKCGNMEDFPDEQLISELKAAREKIARMQEAGDTLVEWIPFVCDRSEAAIEAWRKA